MEFTKDIKFNNMPTTNQDVIITYNGFLKDASDLTIVYGFGESWENTAEVKMEKTENGFIATIKMLDFDTFNFCFRDSKYVWDNNCNCNFISPILPCKNNEKIELLFNELLAPYEAETEPKQTFDIDALIEELLQPIVTKSVQKEENITSAEIISNPVDLGVEITKVLSQIESEAPTEDLAEYSTLDEILSGTIIEETPLELFAEPSIDDIVNEIIENTTKQSNILDEVLSATYEKEATISEEQFKYYSQINDTVTNIIKNIEETEEQQQELEEVSLVTVEDPFVISPRQLSKFYLFRKRIKLAFYKALVKIPKLIFGLEKE